MTTATTTKAVATAPVPAQVAAPANTVVAPATTEEAKAAEPAKKALKKAAKAKEEPKALVIPVPADEAPTSAAAFKPGQRIICIDPGTATPTNPLKKGEVYTFENVSTDGDCIYLQGVTRDTGGFLYFRFRAIKNEAELPKEKGPVVPKGQKGPFPAALAPRLQSGMKVFVRVFNVTGIPNYLPNGDRLRANKIFHIVRTTETGEIFVQEYGEPLTLTHVYPVFQLGDRIKLIHSADGMEAGTVKTAGKVVEDGSYTNVRYDDRGNNTYISNWALENEGPSVAQKTYRQRPMAQVLKNPLNSGVVFAFVKAGTGWKPKTIDGKEIQGPVETIPSIQIGSMIVEQEPGVKDSIEEKMKAMGAAMFLRGERKFFENVIGSKFTENMAATFQASLIGATAVVTPPKQTQEALKPLDNADAELELIRLISHVAQFVDQSQTFRYDTIKKGNARKSLQHMLGWARVGYRRAQQRMANVDVSRLLTGYTNLWKAAEEYLKVASDGDAMTVKWTPGLAQIELNLTAKKELRS